MESLFEKVRNMTMAKHMSDADAQRLRHLVDGMRNPHGPWDAAKARVLRDLDAGGNSSPSPETRPRTAAAATPAPACARRPEAAGCVVGSETDTDALQQELHSARKLLAGRGGCRKVWRQ